MLKRTSFMSRIGAALGLGGLALMVGCRTTEPVVPQYTAPAPKVAPAPVHQAATGCPIIGREGGNIIARQAIPTGSMGSSVVMLEKAAPELVNVGQDFDYTIKVTNLTECELDEVTVTETIASGLNYKSSTPSATRSGELLTWNVGTLAGKASKDLKVKVSAANAGTFTDCARVTYKEKLCITVKAVEPKLILDKVAPASVILCDIIPVKLTVKNPGTGNAENVVITDTLPAGLKTVDGQSVVRINVGTLAPGESKEYSINCQAAKTGSFDNKAVATANGGLSDDAMTTTVVTQPVLAVNKTAPERVYIGRPIKYTIKVDNKGDAVAANTVLTDVIPEGTSFAGASDGGQFANGVITWNLGNLAASGSRTVSATVNAQTQGVKTNRAAAKAVCAEASDTASTRVEGIAAILLEVIDLADPIEVGGEETYVITATNQGSAVGTNITITATLEDSQSYIGSGGATTASVSGRTIKFAPLATLAPKAKAEWTVKVKAVKAGDVRFAIEMQSDQLERPVNETESTHQY